MAPARAGRRLVLLAATAFSLSRAPVQRPSRVSHELGFETLTTNCDFAASDKVLQDEYATRGVFFSGPGFGALNGGVAMNKCAFSSGRFPPLSNRSVSGEGFLGFSTLHVFNDRTGKPIAPETVRFDVRVTNIALGVSGLDGHTLTVELWTGPSQTFDDAGELLQSYTIPLTEELVVHQLADENDIFVDCVRRVEISSRAKMFVIDDFRFDVSAANDGICGIEPGRSSPSAPPPASPGNRRRAGADTSTGFAVSAMVCATSTLLLLVSVRSRRIRSSELGAT